MTPKTTALVIVDLQNDFLHPDGAYGRAEQKSDAIAALPARVKPVADAVRAAKGDFQPGAWGHQLVDELQPADLSVEKIAYSAFHQTRLEFVLKKAGIETLIFCGIVTNGGVASTVRAAHVRDYHTIVLSDGCAAFRPEVHDGAIADLATISEVRTCAEAAKLFA